MKQIDPLPRCQKCGDDQGVTQNPLLDSEYDYLCPHCRRTEAMPERSKSLHNPK